MGRSIALDATGNIIVTGESWGTSGTYDMAVWRYDAAGTLDTSFNSGGAVPGIFSHHDATGFGGEDYGADVAIDPAKQGGWRVEEEFINAIRGLEPVTHTDFATAVKYMEWTDAVGKSMRTGDTVYLPPSGH